MQSLHFRSVRDAILLTGLFLVSSATVVRADNLYNSGSFEAPQFVPVVALEGQDGWQKDAGQSIATISTNSPNGGLQSLQVIRAANASGNTRWSIATPFTSTEALNAVHVDVDMRVNLSGFSFGPAFGIEARNGNQFIGAFSVDAATGEVLYVESGTGQLRSTGKVVSRGVYHHFTLEIDFVNQHYSVSTDNKLLRTEAFVSGTARALSNINIATYAVNPATVDSEKGVAYLDNFAVSSKKVNSAIPAAPTNPSALGGRGNIELNWTASSGANSYKIYRGTAAGAQDPTPIATNVVDTTYTDRDLSDSTTYHYTVTAVNNAGESAPSDQVFATTVAPDLLIESLSANPTTPGVGDSVVLNATVTNNSGSTTATNHAVTFRDSDSVIGTATIDALAPGVSKTVQITWTPQDSGTHKLFAEAVVLTGESSTQQQHSQSRAGRLQLLYLHS